MSFELKIPRPNNAELKLSVDCGELVFVLGANGSGKSSLLHHFYAKHPEKAQRITAHRQTWFTSDNISISPGYKKQMESNIVYDNAQPRSRCTDTYSGYHTGIAISNLIDVANAHARSIEDKVKDVANSTNTDKINLINETAKTKSPITIINDLLRLFYIPITITIETSGPMASRKDGAKYSIEELSDGERNALLLAAHVLTAKPGTLLLIDEPERHLHRSILSPFLTNLFSERPDCAFVISTHDIMLPLDNPTSRTLIVHDCTYQDSKPSSWEVNLVEPNTEIEEQPSIQDMPREVDLVESKTEIDERLKQDILGSRDKILFVEGTERSLDKRLYSLLFPQLSVIAKGSCREVKQSVMSIRNSKDLHWLKAFGIIDKDGLGENEIAKLKNQGVYALPLYSVESLYYHPEIMKHLANKQLAIPDTTQAVTEAEKAAIDEINKSIDCLTKQRAKTSVRQQIMNNLPNDKNFKTDKVLTITINVPDILEKEKLQLTTACNGSDFLSIIARYPVHKGALNQIAEKLKFRNTKDYEYAVRNLLRRDGEILAELKKLFDSLQKAIDACDRGCNEGIIDTNMA